MWTVDCGLSTSQQTVLFQLTNGAVLCYFTSGLYCLISPVDCVVFFSLVDCVVSAD